MKQPAIILLGNMKYILDYAKLVEEYNSSYTLLVFDSDTAIKVTLPSNTLFIPVSEKNAFSEIVQYCQDNNIKVTGVINRKDYFELLHAQLAEKFEVRGPKVSAVTRISDKVQLHQLMEEIGLGQYRPKAVVTTLANIEENISQFSFPLVVKSSFGAKSRTVYIVAQKDDLKEIVQDFIEKTGMAITDSVLVEEFIQGKQVSPICYVDNNGRLTSLGLLDIVTSQDIGQKNLQLAFRALPSLQPVAVTQQIDTILQSIADYSGLTATLLHPEFFVVGEQVYLIEINVRLGGFRKSLLKNAYGIDVHRISFALAVGLPLDTIKQLEGSSAVGEIWSDQSGIVKKIQLPEHPYLKSVIYGKKVGDVYTAPPKAQKQLATFFVKAPQGSLAIAQEIREKTIVEIE